MKLIDYYIQERDKLLANENADESDYYDLMVIEEVMNKLGFDFELEDDTIYILE